VLTIRPPPVDELARRWPEIEPLLRRATDRTDGCYEPVDVLQLALSAQLWVWLIEDAGELAGIATARLNVFPRKRLLTVDFIAGRRLAEWWPLLVAEMDRVARAQQCSTTWLSIPSDCSTRWIQKPSRPASWMTIIGKSRPVRAAALRLSSANRRSSPDTSLAGTECLDIFSPPQATGT